MSIEKDIKEILEGSTEFKYMLLDRMRSDCLGFIDYGRRLWASNPVDHIKIMTAIYDDLKVKPKWLPLAELKRLTYRLTGKEAVSA